MEKERCLGSHTTGLSPGYPAYWYLTWDKSSRHPDDRVLHLWNSGGSASLRRLPGSRAHRPTVLSVLGLLNRALVLLQPLTLSFSFFTCHPLLSLGSLASVSGKEQLSKWNVRNEDAEKMGKKGFSLANSRNLECSPPLPPPTLYSKAVNLFSPSNLQALVTTLASSLHAREV